MIGTLTDVPRPSRRLDAPETAATAAVAVPPTTAARKPIGLMAAGVAVLVAAIGLFAAHGLTGTAPRAEPAPEAAAPEAAAPAGFLISGAESVAVYQSGYEPRESSSWHRHSGLHAVSITSGTLTIYGPDCKPVRYGPGQSYVGGQGLHMARNESDEPVQMTETVIHPAGVPLQNFVVPAGPPAGCDIR